MKKGASENLAATASEKERLSFPTPESADLKDRDAAVLRPPGNAIGEQTRKPGTFSAAYSTHVGRTETTSRTKNQEPGLATMSRVFIVTGANQGIGFEMVRKLARKEGLHTIMTARNAERGKDALEKLQKEFPKASVELMELDLDNDESQEAFVKALKDKHGKVACLVNNAGIAFNSKSKETFEEQTEPTFKTNLFQTFKFTERMLPFLQKEEHPRIVTVASESSKSAFKQLSTDMQKRVTSPDLKPVDVFNFAEDFINAVREGKVEERGFASNNYGMSKLCVVQFTRAYAHEHPEILINCCCPGWCSTRMGSGAGDAPRTPEQGAEVLEFLATADLDGKTGEFWSDNKVVPPFEASQESSS